MTTSGILSYGTYVPCYRLERSDVGATLGGPARRGTRSVASYDEDTTSMGVEAGRVALRGTDASPAQVLFATTVPAYLDKTNATAIHAALGLPVRAAAYDMVGSVRSGVGALRVAADSGVTGRPTMAVLADLRTGLPGGEDESTGGDAAAAFVFGEGNVLAEVIGASCSTVEVLERWRSPGEPASRMWEERFGQSVYAPLAGPAIAEACKQAGVTVDDLAQVLVTGTHVRAVRAVAAEVGAVQDALIDRIGNAGCAHPGLLLANALDSASEGQIIMLVTLADGVEVLLVRATALLAHRQAAQASVCSQLETGVLPVDYASFLTWRGMLHREPPRRPEPQAPAAPPSYRSEEWKFGFVGSRCLVCGSRHLPPSRACFSCHAVDEMVPEALSDVPARIATVTVDHLAYSVSPPTVVAVVDFDGGGRFQCEMTDVEASTVAIGDPVEMTFRRLTTVDGLHNYFWKTRPLRTAVGEEH